MWCVTTLVLADDRVGGDVEDGERGHRDARRHVGRHAGHRVRFEGNPVVGVVLNGPETNSIDGFIDLAYF